MSDYKASEASLIIYSIYGRVRPWNCNTQSEVKDVFLERSDEKLQICAKRKDVP